MHSVSPYLFRCYNKELDGKKDQRYSTLDNIGRHDLYIILKEFISKLTDVYRILEDEKQVYRFTDMVFDDQQREISGWFNVGAYGIKSEIINVQTGAVDFEKAQNNAEIIKHYVHFFIPRGVNEAMAFMHSYRGVGIKTLFYNLFSSYFTNVTRLVIQMNPLAYDNAVMAWLDATAKEVKLTRFVGLQDIADQIRKLGHHEQELVIRAPRNGDLGKLRDYISGGSEKLSAVEFIEEYGAQVKTVVEMGGKRRTFSVGRNRANPLCEIEVPDEVMLVEGVPELTSIKIWVREIVTEYAIEMYRGFKIRVPT